MNCSNCFKKDKKKFKTINVKKDILNNECIICLDDIVQYENAIIIDCGHIYHENCLLKWFKKQYNCPICNFSLE